MTHADQVALRNAQLKRTNGVSFVVVESTTGRLVGDGKAVPYSFAKFVRDTLDAFSSGSHLVKRCN